MIDTIHFERRLNHPIQKVWNAISQAEHISRWFMKADFEARPGYRYQLNGKARDEWDGILKGEILEANPPHFLAYSFESNELIHPMRVTWTLSEIAEGTLLRLEHSGFSKLAQNAERLETDITQGWTKHLGLLQDFLEETLIEKS